MHRRVLGVKSNRDRDAHLPSKDMFSPGDPNRLNFFPWLIAFVVSPVALLLALPIFVYLAAKSREGFWWTLACHYKVLLRSIREVISESLN